jgi:hypothetical protein
VKLGAKKMTAIIGTVINAMTLAGKTKIFKDMSMI